MVTDSQKRLVTEYFENPLTEDHKKDAKKILRYEIGRRLYPISAGQFGLELAASPWPSLENALYDCLDHISDSAGITKEDGFEYSITQTDIVNAMEVARLCVAACRVVQEDDNMAGLVSGIFVQLFASLLNISRQYKASYHRLLAKLDKMAVKLDDAKAATAPVKVQPETKAVAALKKQLKSATASYGKQLAQVEHDLSAEYSKQIQDLEQEIASLHNRLNAAVAELGQSTDPDHATELPEIPDKGVIVCGGHQNFLYKLKALYPDWLYNPKSTAFGAKYKVVIHEHTNHRNILRVDSANPGLHTIYVRSTNIATALLEIQQGLLQYQEVTKDA